MDVPAPGLGPPRGGRPPSTAPTPRLSASRVNTLNSRLDVARTESRLLVQERDAAIQELAAANLEKSRLAKDMALAQKEHEATTANLRDLLAKAQEQVTQLTERLDNAQLEINNLHMKLRARSLSDTSGIPSGESPSTPMPGAAMHMHQESFSGGALSPRHPPHQHHHHHHHHQQQQQMQAATGGSPDNGQGLSRRASILLQSEHSPSMSLSAITLPGFLQPARSLIAAAEHRDTHEIISHTGAIVFIVSQFIDDCLLICKDSPAMPLEVREFVFIIEKDLQLRLSKLLNTSQSIATGSGPQMAVPEMTPLLVSIGNNTQEMLRAVAPFRPVAMHQASGSFSQSQQQQPPPYPQHQQQFSQSQFSQQQQQQQQQQQPYYSPLPSPHQYHHQQAGPLRSSAPIQPNATHPSLLGAGQTSAPVLSASSAGTAAGAGPRLMGGDPMSPSHFIGGSMSSSSSSGMLTSTSDSPHGGWSPAPGGGGPGSRSGPSPGPGNASAPLSTATIDQATDDGSSGVHRHIAILIDEIIAESRGLAQHLKAYQTKHGELRTEGVPPHALAHSPSLLDLSAQCLAALDCVIRPAQTLRDFAFSHRTTAFRRSLYSAVEKLLTDISEHVAGLGQAQADLRANPGIGAESISSVLVPLLRQINHLKSLLPPGSH
ncbi:hypothetical protein H696_01466 [Fonticula alba]|uniref:Uncharacterized protein n=1 Tax=Fonticula alba TaxID=691883 RepID=A0A058ZF03_FONAL|nr:hypothetical protein H696_01466 [Fonticula alba]KCV72057.1 hypothetical protein H696_01466 [Fonticula alba]|eukprot:XP_009493635.1 hypothetical protein H696_01466 [Fonticula alba]